MGEKEYIVYLDDVRQNRYRHFHRTERGLVVTFCIQYEAHIGGKWRAIVRYDTAHGFPHKDTLHPDGTQTKETFPSYSNAEVLTMGQQDIWRNWKRHRRNYEREMRHIR
ncbi:MAG: hypothetical protein KAW49_13975 [Anaerolineae bacterium]|nr:hypothetical protein [Anaerolineae bacterium]MCK4450248.1 hypothetical protein [Anaerolineae bacterium]MCK4472884.1 hypothetical protein [Anaerolineae bacterium]